MRALVVAALAIAACGRSKPEPAVGSGSPTVSATPAQATTPRAFFARGVPTYITGTAGDDHADRAIAAQIDLVRSLLTPDAKRIADTDVSRSAWPPNPIVYGGSHVNAVIATLAPDLPFSITAGKLSIGDLFFEGDGLALMTVVPALAGEHGHPELLLFAGTGTPGTDEINSNTVMRADAPIVIADAFGPLVTGTWIIDPDGTRRAELGPRNRRVGWRDITKDVAGVVVTFRFFDKSSPTADATAIDRTARGITTVVDKLAITGPLSMTVYVHPDRRSKQSLTGNGGDGHAVAFARALHVLDGDGLESLVAHEATHVIVTQAWGPAGSPLFGEGLAVWVAGQYGGTPFADFRKLPRPALTIRELLGPKFRSLPEGTSYPLAALVVDVAIAKLGLAAVRHHLYGATAATWDDACRRAGIPSTALDDALAR